LSPRRSRHAQHAQPDKKQECLMTVFPHLHLLLDACLALK
jgi:hypothetical protein